MMRCNNLFRAIFILALINLPILSKAETQDIDQATSIDRNYVSFGTALNEFRSIHVIYDTRTGGFAAQEFPLTAQTYATAATLGTYITENFKTELRFGKGIRDDTVDEAMDININYWFNWYIGPTYPITDYMSAYALFGLSHFDTDITRKEKTISVSGGIIGSNEAIVHPSLTRMEEDLIGTSFSTSWMLGLDFHLVDQWFLAFEYGRLLRDTDTGIKVYQAGTYLRYEF